MTATFDQAVAVTGKPRIRLRLIGGTTRGDRWAEYASGSGTTALVFAYPVVATEESDTSGIEVGDPSLQADNVDLNGGTITVVASGENASLSYAPLFSDSGHRVNWARPTLSGAVTSTDGTKVLLTFSENLDEIGLDLSLFTVKVGGTAVTLSGTAPTVSGRVVTLTLATALTSATQAVTVSYADPTTGDDPGTVEDLAFNDADSFTDQPVTNRFGSTTAPAVTFVEFYSSPNNNTWAIGEEIGAEVTFSAAVDITGTPQLELDFAGTPKAAACDADTNTTAMVCFYTVAVGDSAPNGVAIAANKLTLNGGTITATGSTTITAVLAHAAVAIDAGQKVDGIRPTLVTTGSEAPTTSADGTKVILTFSEDIGSVTPSLITIEGNSVALPTSGDNIVGPTVELTLTTALTDSAASLTVALAVGAVTDAVSNDNAALAATTVINAVVSATTPTVTGVALTSDPSSATYGYNIGGVIEATVTFSAAVDITGTPQLELDFDGTPKPAGCTAATITTTMACSYTVAVNDSAPNGIAIAANKLTLNGGTITATGSTTLTADLTHAAVAIDAGQKVDGIRPTLVTTGSEAPKTSTDGTQVILTFSETVTGVNRFNITIMVGTNTLSTSAARTAGTTVELDLSTVIDATVMLTVALGGSAVFDGAGNFNLAVAATAVINAVVSVSATTPTVTGVALTSDPGTDNTYAISDTVTATVTFSAAVDITGTPQLELDVAGTPKAAACVVATNTTTTACEYEVVAGDSAPNGIAIGANKLTGGTIYATGGTTTSADLTHVAVAIDVGHKVDGIRPTLVTTGSEAPKTSTDGTKVILTFNEDIGGVSRSDITIQANSVTAATSAASVTGTKVELTLTTALTTTATNLTVALAAAAVKDDAGNGILAVAATAVTNAVGTTVSNTAPTFANPTETRSVAENSAVGTNVGAPVTATDTDSGDTLTYTLEGTNAAAFEIVSTSGQIRTRSGVTYTQSTYAVIVKADDGNGGSATVAVTITVTVVTEPPPPPPPVNAAPLAVDDAAETAEDTPVTIAVLENDRDADGDPLTVAEVSAPAHGTARLTDAGTVEYTPEPDFHGSDRFTYVVDDGTGETARATVDVTVQPVNDPPQALDDAGDTPEDTPVTIAVLENDRDGDGDALALVEASAPAHGTARLTDAGTVEYTPEPDFHGSDRFTYTVGDGSGLTAQAAVAVTVQPVNDPPQALDDAADTPEDTPVTIVVLENDRDGDALALVEASAPAYGTARLTDASTVEYTPEPDFHGSDRFTYTVGDGSGLTAQAAVAVTVQPVNDPPQALDDAADTPEDTPVTIAVLENDRDADGDPLTVAEVSAPAHGTARLTDAGAVEYTPEPDYHGSDRFTYAVGDGSGLTAQAAVAVTVQPVNDPPQAIGVIPDQTLEAGDGPALLDLRPFFEDRDGDDLGYAAVASDQAVGLSLAGATLTLTVARPGAATVTVTAQDPGGLTATQAFMVATTDRQARGVVEDTLAALARGHLASARATLGRRVETTGQEESRVTVAGMHVLLGTGAGGVAAAGQAVAQRWIAGLTGGMPLQSGGWTGMGAAPGAEAVGALGSHAATLGMAGGAPFGGAGPAQYGTGASPAFSGLSPLGGGGQTDFLLALGSGQAGGGAAQGPRWTVWGQFDRQSFAGEPSLAARYDGDLRTTYVGVDARLRERWLAGVAVSHSRGDGDWNVGTSTGRLSTNLTSVQPYLRWSDGGTTIWATAGGGSGSAENERLLYGRQEESDLGLRLGLVEVRRRLATVGPGVELQLRGDASWARLTTAAGDELIDALEVDVRQLRVGIDVRRPVRTAGGTLVEPFGEVHARHDGGSGQTGAGLEVAGGLRVARGVFRVEGMGRLLALHAADGYREHGAAVTLSVGNGARQPGLTLSLTPRWGAPATASDALWQDQLVHQRAAGTPGARRDERALDTRVDYGLPLPAGGLLTPFGIYGQSPYGRRLQVGLLLSRLGPLGLEVSGERSALLHPGRDEYRMSVLGSITFGGADNASASMSAGQ